MIYELRVSQIRPRGVPEYEKRLEAALPARERHSKLAGCWHTEIGPLNQVVELWAYEDRAHYDRVAEAVAAEGGWPPVAGDLVQSVQVDVLQATPFARKLTGEAQKFGPYYEMRIYQVKTGYIPEMIEKWAPMIPPRETLSPCVGVWYSEQGLWFHVWAYSDLAARAQIRDEAGRQKLWPPPTADFFVSQANKILLPASFSPLQ